MLLPEPPPKQISMERIASLVTDHDWQLMFPYAGHNVEQNLRHPRDAQHRYKDLSDMLRNNLTIPLYAEDADRRTLVDYETFDRHTFYLFSSAYTAEVLSEIPNDICSKFFMTRLGDSPVPPTWLAVGFGRHVDSRLVRQLNVELTGRREWLLQFQTFTNEWDRRNWQNWLREKRRNRVRPVVELDEEDEPMSDKCWRHFFPKDEPTFVVDYVPIDVQSVYGWIVIFMGLVALTLGVFVGEWAVFWVWNGAGGKRRLKLKNKEKSIAVIKLAGTRVDSRRSRDALLGQMEEIADRLRQMDVDRDVFVVK